jgi:hypothetical protein
MALMAFGGEHFSLRGRHHGKLRAFARASIGNLWFSSWRSCGPWRLLHGDLQRALGCSPARLAMVKLQHTSFSFFPVSTDEQESKPSTYERYVRATCTSYIRALRYGTCHLAIYDTGQYYRTIRKQYLHVCRISSVIPWGNSYSELPVRSIILPFPSVGFLPWEIQRKLKY